MRAALCLLALAAGPCGAAPARFHEMSEAQISTTLRRIHARGGALAGRIDRVSAAFLGTPYRLNPLGEGQSGEYDQDPLYSFKAADCTTLVEQVLALSLEPDLGRAVALLQKIRYKDGDIRYEKRRHFPEVDWLPGLAAAGFLKDITRSVAGDKTKTISKAVSKRQWYLAKSSAALEGFVPEPSESWALRWRALGAAMPDEKAALDYLPIENLADFAAKIPAGTIASLVREDKEGIPVVVSHQVLILGKNEKKIVRHAASGKSVEDVPLLEYFYRYFGARWKLLGLNLAEPLQPQHRPR